MKRPSFQFYPADWLSDPNVQVMTPEQRGGYIQLLALMWNTEDCKLWNDIDYLCKLSGLDRVAIALPLRCFKVEGDQLYHKRLNEERKKQDTYREACSKAGSKGNEIRWHKPKESGSDRVGIAKDRSSSTSSSTTASSNKNIYGEKFEKLSYVNKGLMFKRINDYTKSFNQAPSQKQIEHWIDTEVLAIKKFPNETTN